MRCLEAAGMEADYDPLLDLQWSTVSSRPEYNPNPNGFYHCNDEDTDYPSYYDDHKGRLIKIPRTEVGIVSPGKYKVIFMTRNPDEILASMRAFVPFRSWGKIEMNIYFYDLLKAATLETMRARLDMEVLEIFYPDVISDPTTEFTKIKDFGFPINVSQASAMVDPELYRFRLEQK